MAAFGMDHQYAPGATTEKGQHMAFVSFEMVQKILKDCEGKTFQEAMNGCSNSVREWERYVESMYPLTYQQKPRIRVEQDHKGTVKKVAVIEAVDIVQASSSTPTTVTTCRQSEADRMWNLICLAAEASRYGE